MNQLHDSQMIINYFIIEIISDQTSDQSCCKSPPYFKLESVGLRCCVQFSVRSPVVFALMLGCQIKSSRALVSPGDVR